MRARFFRIIFLVVTLVALACVLIHGWFLRETRLDSIDAQVRDVASTLLDSDLVDLRLVQIEEVEKILTEELGEDRIGKFFILRDDAGSILYESSSAKLLPIDEVPRFPQWVTIRAYSQYIRVLNLDLPRIQNRTLQVGIVVDAELVSAFPPARSIVVIVSAALLIGSLAAWLLTSFLMRPIANLSIFLSGISSEKIAYAALPPLPEAMLGAHANSKSDEMSILLESLNRLIERINRGYRTSRAWSFQMAHELKTPLAIIETELNQAQEEGRADAKLTASIREELMQASSAVTAFLSWAELEVPVEANQIYATRISSVLRELKIRLEKQFPGRLLLNGNADFSVLARKQHLELVLSNLARNALLYSSAPVTILTEGNALKILDKGPGFSEEVLRRWGDPFNKGSDSKKGHGLGLAFVISVCRLYGWQISAMREQDTTTLLLRFPEIGSEL